MRAVVLLLALAALAPASAFVARPGFAGLPSRVAKTTPVRAQGLSDLFRRRSLRAPATTSVDGISLEESVDKATRHWCSQVTSGAEDNWKKVCALYAPEAKLWATVSEDLREGKDLEDYFKFFAHIPGLKLKDGSYKSSVQVMGDSAVNSGYYTFLMDGPEGTTKEVPARFTFVYKKRAEPTADGIMWDIVNHHSSAVPAQPEALAPVGISSVDEATRHWCATVTSGAEDNWKRVSALYAPEALLWATVSEDIRSGQDLQDYFKFFAHMPGLSLKEGSYKSYVQMSGKTAVNSGYYTFVVDNEDGTKREVPARFTFCYRRRDEPTADGIMWDIVNHHSSAVPAQPEALKPILAKQA